LGESLHESLAIIINQLVRCLGHVADFGQASPISQWFVKFRLAVRRG
jgi:hypothetical protein